MSRPLAVHEEHGEVVGTWRALGYHKEVVVCFDRHLDLKPLGEAAASQLRSATGVDALRALNRSLPVREAPGAFGLDDFFAAGPVLETVQTLWWVVPGRWPSARDRVRSALNAIAKIPIDLETLPHTRADDGVLSTRLCGLDLQIHSLETLRDRGVPANARVDVDLDWLVDGDAPAQHTPNELVGALLSLECLDRLDSLTWSIRSGFLPDSMRGTALQIAEEASRTLDRVSWEAAIPIPERTFSALRTICRPGQRTALEAELAPLGVIGTVLKGCLAAKEGDINCAVADWWQAAHKGLPSCWLAHSIGVAHYAEEPEAALEWFERACGLGTDTLQTHAASLAMFCLLRLGRMDEARVRVEALVARHPFHQKLVRIGVLTAADSARRQWFVEHEQRIAGLLAVGE